MTHPTLDQLSRAFSQLMEEDYSFNFSRYEGSNIYCTLSKRTTSQATLEIQGNGPTVEEAVAAAFSNFPKNPLDGTKWVNNQLAAPQTIISDAEEIL